MRRGFLAFAVLATLLGLVGQAQASIAIYVHSTSARPSASAVNERAMDAVFGAGNWIDARYETLDAATLLSADFVLIEGAAGDNDGLKAFMAENFSTIQAWVSGGGSLVVDALPEDAVGMSLGFGVQSSRPEGVRCASAVDPAHPIFNGPLAASPDSCQTGEFGVLSAEGGLSLSPIMVDRGGNTVLGEMEHGLGCVVFAAMATDRSLHPEVEDVDLMASVIAYVCDPSKRRRVPEPSTLIVWLSLIGVTWAGASWRLLYLRRWQQFEEEWQEWEELGVRPSLAASTAALATAGHVYPARQQYADPFALPFAEQDRSLHDG
ncbi:MAG: hypothetical protein A2V70_06820 [Planctomycetes bacterium RBG_13_63_9]|nr:MAG: hypothetical protein A2V70_06820 [Planctomycetes bacterium RBG_13_63_9]